MREAIAKARMFVAHLVGKLSLTSHDETADLIKRCSDHHADNPVDIEMRAICDALPCLTVGDKDRIRAMIVNRTSYVS